MNKPYQRNNNFRGKKDLHKINNFISAADVRVILDDGEQLGVMKKNEAKKKQKVIETKELKIRPGTGEHDYQVKIRNAQKFLKEGNRVKFSLRFKGREMEHSNLGIDMLKRVKTDLGELIRVEMEPKIEGRQAFLVVAPK